ncbi:cupin domain-containing protein [Geothrix sp. PMB-07]|uniref:cupin domain-containing protein n=1 Tax=Geothrix sp. PMB-07 TaxID=3068640 RepID=UPI002740CDA8|nr:cupin domain-containing protein [Geothrix sp. PMB-07]WLT30108.1 cupin domain-containing protein [Geothrix sp. PMB-07]
MASRILRLGVISLALAGLGAFAQEAPRHSFTFAGKRPSYDRKEVVSDIALSSVQSEGRFSILDEIWHSDFVVPPHFHATHTEVFYILGGSVEWTVNGETHVMKTGDMVYIPPRSIHAVKVVGGKDAHMLMLYEAGGYEEHILREQAYTEEQMKDPKLKAELRKLNDFNPVTKTK